MGCPTRCPSPSWSSPPRTRRGLRHQLLPTPRWTGSWCACHRLPRPRRRDGHGAPPAGRTPGVRPVLEAQRRSSPAGQAGQVYVSDEVLDYIVRLVGATRSHPMILKGASPRATLALTAMAKAAALVRGRDYVLPEDVSLVFGDVVPHRLLLSPRAEADRSFDPASELLERVPAPRIS
ncbi:MAG: AAA family ATPase [Flavonifractor plautii]